MAARNGTEAETKKIEKPASKRRSKKELVKSVMEKVEQTLEAGQLKPTVGDFIRLAQLEKELDDEQPTEIKVSWVEPDETEHASEK